MHARTLAAAQVWVKSPQLLMRDRLLGTYTVKPTIQRLQRTLLGLGGERAQLLLGACTSPRERRMRVMSDD